MEKREEPSRKIAWLESRLDQVESELSYLNGLLMDCGFPKGVESLKATIEELVQEVGNERVEFPFEEGNPPTSTFDPFE